MQKNFEEEIKNPSNIANQPVDWSLGGKSTKLSLIKEYRNSSTIDGHVLVKKSPEYFSIKDLLDLMCKFYVYRSGYYLPSECPEIYKTYKPFVDVTRKGFIFKDGRLVWDKNLRNDNLWDQTEWKLRGKIRKEFCSHLEDQKYDCTEKKMDELYGEKIKYVIRPWEGTFFINSIENLDIQSFNSKQYIRDGLLEYFLITEPNYRSRDLNSSLLEGFDEKTSFINYKLLDWYGNSLLNTYTTNVKQIKTSLKLKNYNGKDNIERFCNAQGIY